MTEPAPTPAPRQLFRPEALERLSAPERLDELMRVVTPRTWLVLAALGAIVVGGALWSVLGEVPIRLDGRGVLVHPRRVVSVQAPATGQLLTIAVRPGDRLAAGQVVGQVDRTLLGMRLEAARAALEARRRRGDSTGRLRAARAELEGAALDGAIEVLARQVAEDAALGARQADEEARALTRERRALEAQLEALQAGVDLQRLVAKQYATLAQEGLATGTRALEAEFAVRQAELAVSERRAQLEGLSGRELELEARELARRHRREDGEGRLRDLRARRAQVAEELGRAVAADEAELDALERDRAALALELEKTSTVRTPWAGRVLGVSAHPGRVVGAGGALLELEVEDPTAPLVCVAAFPAHHGKRLAPGQRVRLDLDHVERDRWGSLSAHVDSVAPFPPTDEEIAAVVGGPQVARALGAPPGALLAQVALEPDPGSATGYRWSSSAGPPVPLTAGATASLRITIERRRPITFVLPFLRGALGLE